jgi:hypothetical protein
MPGVWGPALPTMKRVGSVLALVIFAIAAAEAKSTKKSLRVELAEQQRSLGYSLADVLRGQNGQVYVVSVEDRTVRLVKAKDVEKLHPQECSSPQGRYSVFRRNGGLWLRDNETSAAELVEAEGQYSTQCFSPEGKFTYSTGRSVRIYDLAKKKGIEVDKGTYPAWSPDGKWVGFDDGKHYVLLSPTTGIRRKLFSTKDSAGPDWSPDSRYLTYTKAGGSTGGFLFWGIKCIEPYRVWVWRVEDDAHEWVDQTCKPGFGFLWVKNSDLLIEKP